MLMNYLLFAGKLFIQITVITKSIYSTLVSFVVIHVRYKSLKSVHYNDFTAVKGGQSYQQNAPN